MDKILPSVSGTGNPFIEWLLSDGMNITAPDELVKQLAEKLADSGLPLYRMRVLIRTLHPQVFATHYTWLSTSGKVEVFSPPHEALKLPVYLLSPIAKVFEGSDTIRRRLDIPNPKLDFPYLKNLLAEGGTDYVVMPMLFHNGEINAVTLASDQPGGFTDSDLALVAGMLPLLSRLLEVHAIRDTAQTLLETYLGGETGRRVLNGLVKRGDGEMIHAVIWFCDLRDSVGIAKDIPMEEFLSVLNDFFDCMAGAVLDHGGEVLRFIGDAALAIFPFDQSSKIFEGSCRSAKSACARSLIAARDAQKRITTLNKKRAAKDLKPLGFGLALHVGDVMYVNIGTPQRLEFTVIGQAANEASRLQGLCKELNQPILISPDFPQCNSKQMIPLGPQKLRGVSDHWNVFALSDEADAACEKCY